MIYGLPKEIFVALIAAFGALLVAIVGLFSSIRSAKKQRDTQLQLEEVKDGIATRAEKRRRRAEKLKQQLDLVAADIELIQASRDLLRRAIDPPASLITASEFLESLLERISDMEKQYRHRLSLDETDNGIHLHMAKGIMIALEQLLKPRPESFVSDFSPEEVRCVQKARAELQSVQEALRNIATKAGNAYLDL